MIGAEAYLKMGNEWEGNWGGGEMPGLGVLLVSTGEELGEGEWRARGMM